MITEAELGGCGLKPRLPQPAPSRARTLEAGERWADTTERLHFHFSLSCVGEGHGNPLQCSCLENPRDGALSRLGAELELRRSGSSLGEGQ